ncbi:hypothetical protein ACI3PL_25790, partial [Lacticaseibacillus paracasei]
TITGDSGSCSAASASDTLLIKGVDGIATVVGDASPDQVGISIRLPATTSAEAGASYLALWTTAGTKKAVKVYTATS